MKAVVKTARGPGNVELQDRDLPEPSHDQVAIDVTYAGICGSDIAIYHDTIALKLEPPVVMGHEFVGTIADLGPGVDGWAVGDRVVAETAFAVCGRCEMCRSGHDNVCRGKELIGYVHDGVFAERVVVPASRLHRPPSGASDETVALAEQLAGCVHGLLEQTTIRAGDLVVIAGPGAIGLISLLIASALGARTVVTGRSRQRLERARSLGADHVVDITTEDPGDLVAELSDGRGCDVFVECTSAGAGVQPGLELLRRRGRFLMQGLMPRPVDTKFDLIAYKELFVTGTMGQKATAWELAMRLLDEHRLPLERLVDQVLPLQRWEEAFAMVERGGGGKVLLSPRPSEPSSARQA